MLKSWIGKPLVNKAYGFGSSFRSIRAHVFPFSLHRILQERIDAVDEILNTQSHTLDNLRIVIKRLPDLVKGLCRIQYGKVHFYRLLHVGAI